MKIEVKKFGTHLISRPEGRDAALVLRNQFLNKTSDSELIFDFEGVLVLTPSWLDEILQEVFKTHQKNQVLFENTSNSSVAASIETVVS